MSSSPQDIAKMGVAQNEVEVILGNSSVDTRALRQVWCAPKREPYGLCTGRRLVAAFNTTAHTYTQMWLINRIYTILVTEWAIITAFQGSAVDTQP
jgi:hypothetical protein